MEPIALAIAGVAALAILLIAVGIATSGGSGISDRLERYASTGQADKKAAASTGQGPVTDFIAQSQALANLNRVVEQRDFGANLAREIARADLKLKVSEYLLIWAGCIVGVPAGMFLLSFALPDPGQPALPAHRRPRSASSSRASGSTAARAAGWAPSTSSCRTPSP